MKEAPPRMRLGRLQYEDAPNDIVLTETLSVAEGAA
jgi:hypothetical protein